MSMRTSQKTTISNNKAANFPQSAFMSSLIILQHKKTYTKRYLTQKNCKIKALITDLFSVVLELV